MQGSTLHIVVAILAGSILVALAIVLKFSGSEGYSLVATTTSAPTRDEHRLVYGNPDAETTIVEFSDYECPFCARLHPTLKQIVDESEGTIVWEYRHLPLENHPLAFPAAVMSECVAENVGLDAFWQYSDAVFLAMGQLTQESIKTIATSLGVSAKQYEECQNDLELRNRVEIDRSVASALGGRGTPFSVIVKADGSQTPVSGALPREQWMALLNQP